MHNIFQGTPLAEDVLLVLTDCELSSLLCLTGLESGIDKVFFLVFLK